MDNRIRVENGTLLIANATYEDEGVYICKAVNVFGRRGAIATGDKRVQQSTVSIERRLRVKSECFSRVIFIIHFIIIIKFFRWTWLDASTLHNFANAGPFGVDHRFMRNAQTKEGTKTATWQWGWWLNERGEGRNSRNKKLI